MSAQAGRVSHDVARVVADLRRKRVQLWIDAGQLRYRAPRGVMTGAELELLHQCSDELVALLAHADQGDSVPAALPRRDAMARIPLTFSQLAHWRSNRLDRCSTVRHLSSATHLRGPLDPDLLRQSLGEVISRHDSLRTRITLTDDGTCAQVVAEPAADCALVLLDLRGHAPSAHLGALESLLEQLVLEPIRAEVDPLWAVKLVRLHEHEHVLLVAMEHIISDAFSMGLLTRDLLRAYREIPSGGCRWTPLPIQFADYAVWQSNAQFLLERGRRRLEHLDGCVRLRLPGDVDPGRMRIQGWGSVPVVIDSAMQTRLLRWCRQRQTTLVMCMFAVFAALVLRWCKASRGVIRYVTDGRFRPELGDAIGFFAAPLYLRVELTAGDQFADLIERLTQEYCQAYEHHDLFYIDALEHPPQFTRNPCFNWVAMQSGDKSTSDLELQAQPLRLGNPLLKVYAKDLEPGMLLRETAAGIVGGIQFPLNRFSSARMERFRSEFLTLLEGLLEAPEARVSELKLA